MGRYIEWDDAIDRYPELNTLAGADELSSAYIVYAETFIDGMLASDFTPPFSNNNSTVRDLTIDNVYYRAGRFKTEDASRIWSESMQFIKMLKKGDAEMISTSGDLLGLRNTGTVFSTTQSYHSAFGMNPVEEQHIDEDQITADRNVD